MVKGFNIHLSMIELAHRVCVSAITTGGEAIKVVVRCRPFIKEEAKTNRNCIHISGEDSTVVVLDKSGNEGDKPKKKDGGHKFTFDTVFGTESSQEEVYERSVKNMIPKLLEGFNSTVFAYGQTSSGKTHTMMGKLGDQSLEGLTPRLTRQLFRSIEESPADTEFVVTLSYMEIYNEQVFDLLPEEEYAAPKSRGRRNRKKHEDALKIRQGKGGFFVENLARHIVKSYPEVVKLIRKGSSRRSVAATDFNSESSRSHAIVVVYVEHTVQPSVGKKHIVAAKLNLVDLAGSERFQGKTKDMAKESTSINQSLSTLANVIAVLASGKKGFVPYRNSALTMLLKDSLGGHASTVMFANINPCDRHSNETTSTLRYAARAKKIKNRPRVNQDPKNALLKQLQSEIEKLKALLEEKDKIIASAEAMKGDAAGSTEDVDGGKTDGEAAQEGASDETREGRTISIQVEKTSIHIS
eukprot:jgi/Bigna1/76445/fgenesh1_pg.41_\